MDISIQVYDMDEVDQANRGDAPHYWAWPFLMCCEDTQTLAKLSDLKTIYEQPCLAGEEHAAYLLLKREWESRDGFDEMSFPVIMNTYQSVLAVRPYRVIVNGRELRYLEKEENYE